MRYLIGLLCVLICPGSATAAPSASDALTSLQEAHTSGEAVFVEQDDIDFLIDESGGGPCASCAAADAIQSLRLMAGLDAIDDIHLAALEGFKDQEELLAGRVTNDQFVKLIEFYQQHLGGASVTVDVESAPNSTYSDGKEAWSADGAPDLSLAPSELKVVSYTVTTEGGEVLGRHFVLLKEYDGKLLKVVDPAVPTKRREYELVPVDGGRFQLQRPGGANSNNDTYEINTVFTIRLDAGSDGLTLEGIKAEIDATAKRLKGQGQLKSPRRWRTETADAGLPALDLPTDVGGANWPAVKMIEVFRHAGRHDLNLRDVVGGAHARVLLKSTHPDVQKIVKQIAEGKGYMAIAITEPDHGSDFTSIETTATKVDGGWRLNGEKKFNARLDQATHVVVFTKSQSGERGRLSVFVLPIDAEGIEIKRFGAHGLVGNSFGGMALKDVFVPDSHQIGGDDDGKGIFNDHFCYWRLMQSAAAIGTAERALEMMAERLDTRKVYGKKIGSFTHLQQPLGEYRTKLTMAHSVAVNAAEMIDRGAYDSADVLVCGLKAEGIEFALEAVDAAARAYGAEGYSDFVDIGERLRDLNGLRIADGATDVLRSAVVKKAYGDQFWNMAFKKEEQP